MAKNSLNFTFVFMFIVIASYHYKNVCGAHYNDLSVKNGVQARLYVPSLSSNAKLPLVIYYHGGGFVSYSAKNYWYNDLIRSLVDRSDVIVLSVDYHLAFYPDYVSGTYRDSWAALEYVASHTNGTGPNPRLNTKIDFERVFLSGDGAGGNIAHNMAMRMGSSDKINGLQIKGIALICPYFWGVTPIGGEPANAIGRSVQGGLWVAASGSENLDDTHINPLSDPKLPTLGASQVLVITGTIDPLVYRGEYYAQALQSNGYKGSVYYESYNIEHDTFMFLPYSAGYSDTVDRVSSFINNG